MEKKNIVDSLVGIIKETEEQDKMLQSQNVGWRKELRERFDWTQNTTIKGKVELEKFIQQELDKAREEGSFTIEELEVIRELCNFEYEKYVIFDLEDSKVVKEVGILKSILSKLSSKE